MLSPRHLSDVASLRPPVTDQACVCFSRDHHPSRSSPGLPARTAGSRPAVISTEIKSISFHSPLPTLLHFYVWPFLFFAYPFAAYIYLLRYDEFLGDRANTFIGSVVLFGSHALTWLATKWSMSFRAAVTSVKVGWGC